MSECGTNAGYERHRKAGEDACYPCKAARAAYSRAYRAGRDDWRMANSARSKALTRLSHEHWPEYQALYADELGKQREAS